MNIGEVLKVVMMQALYQLPYLIMDGIGIVLSIKFWQRNPGKFRLTLIYFSIGGLANIGGIFFSIWPMLAWQGDHFAEYGIMQFIISILFMIVGVTNCAILLFALFSPKYNLVEIAPEP